MGTALARTSTASPRSDALSNRLLAGLSDADWQRWRPQLEVQALALGRSLAEPGVAQHWVHFPTTALVSLFLFTENGQSVEVAVVGNEGLVGSAPFMGGESTPHSALVQSPGQGYRLPAAFVRAEFNQSATVRHLLLHYTLARIAQISQTALCIRHHSILQQLCRWLLLSMDRLPGNTLSMTHELIAHNLGVRREGVTEAALELQCAGLMRYAHGHIEILDRKGLESRACECYAVIRREYTRLLPDAQAAVSQQDVQAYAAACCA